MIEGHGKPIWYFVGLILMIMGGIIFCVGIYFLFTSLTPNTVLAETYPNIWWGGIMIVCGGGLYWKTKKES